MPMTKAEKMAMYDLQLRAALNWPPTPPAPVSKAELDALREPTYLWWTSKGVSFWRDARVGLGVVESNLHSTTPFTREQLANRYSGGSRVTLSQGQGGPWYRSQEDALAALHHAVAKECAERLRAVELQIENLRELRSTNAAALADLVP